MVFIPYTKNTPSQIPDVVSSGIFLVSVCEGTSPVQCHGAPEPRYCGPQQPSNIGQRDQEKQNPDRPTTCLDRFFHLLFDLHPQIYEPGLTTDQSFFPSWRLLIQESLRNLWRVPEITIEFPWTHMPRRPPTSHSLG